MSYIIKVQMRDTVIECEDENKMNETFDDLVKENTKLGIPSDNIILVGSVLSDCDQGFTHNHDLRRHPPEPE